MGTLVLKADERVKGVRCGDDALAVDLMDGQTITVPLWPVSAAGHGIHWPDADEDLSAEGLLRGSPAPRLQA